MAAIGIIGSMLGFTESMQSLIISLHFSQDSFGTATNIMGDQAIAFVVDAVDQKHSESRQKPDKQDPASSPFAIPRGF